jgi:hypothetical protein
VGCPGETGTGAAFLNFEVLTCVPKRLELGAVLSWVRADRGPRSSNSTARFMAASVVGPLLGGVLTDLIDRPADLLDQSAEGEAAPADGSAYCSRKLLGE